MLTPGKWYRHPQPKCEGCGERTASRIVCSRCGLRICAECDLRTDHAKPALMRQLGPGADKTYASTLFPNIPCYGGSAK